MAGIKDFSTSEMDPAASLAAWRQYMAEVYYKLDIVPVDGERVRGSLSEQNIESVCVSSFKADAQRVIRRKEAAHIDGSENFVFLFPLKGQLSYRQRNNEGCIAPGDVVILNSAENYVVDVPDGSENVTLKIRRDLLHGRIKWLDSCCAQSNVADKQIVPIVTAMATQFLSMSDTHNGPRLQEICFDLLALMVETRSGSYRGERYSSCLSDRLFENVKAYIGKTFSNPDLSIADVAAACKVSDRYVHKVCHDRGTTFGRELMEIRLLEAHRLLSHPSLLQIGQIAYLCGFSNQAHFAVRYRRRFGTAPSDTRRALGDRQAAGIPFALDVPSVDAGMRKRF